MKQRIIGYANICEVAAMNVICAWCKTSLGEKAPLENTCISHGICPECQKIIAADIRKEFPDASDPLVVEI